MGGRHDRESGLPALRSGVERASHDVLSDVLRTAKLTGALFFRVDAAPPWEVGVPASKAFAPIILPGVQHVVSYHVVTHGTCWGAIIGEPPVALAAGDVLVFPHGDPYVMSSAPVAHASVDLDYAMAFFRLMAAGELPFTVAEGGSGAERLHLICGFLGCDARPFNPLLQTLPRMLHVRAADAPGNDLLGRLIELTIGESRANRAGGDCIRLRLSELLFVEVVRRHLASLPPAQTGWLAALKDRAIGRALALLHERPEHPWTLDELASAVGSSRSVLAERFSRFLGHPPMQYLTYWRMQVAARLLADGGKVVTVASQVGYSSEAAFSRTFKKVTGVSPGEWRRR